MLQTEPAPALLTIFRVHLRGELDAERLLDGPVIIETGGGRTIISAADADAERKLRAAPAVHAIERVGRAIIVPDRL